MINATSGGDNAAVIGSHAADDGLGSEPILRRVVVCATKRLEKSARGAVLSAGKPLFRAILWGEPQPIRVRVLDAKGRLVVTGPALHPGVHAKYVTENASQNVTDSWYI